MVVELVYTLYLVPLCSEYFLLPGFVILEQYLHYNQQLLSTADKKVLKKLPTLIPEEPQHDINAPKLSIKQIIELPTITDKNNCALTLIGLAPASADLLDHVATVTQLVPSDGTIIQYVASQHHN